jgi:hypothetical protein
MQKINSLTRTIYFLKDQSNPEGVKKQKKALAETVYFKPRQESAFSPDTDETEVKPEITTDNVHLIDADQRFLDMTRCGIFACPRFDNIFENGDARIE